MPGQITPSAGAGHAAHLQQPDAFATLVRAWVATLGDGGTP